MDILKTIKKNIIKMLILAISFSAISYIFVGFIQMQKISVNVYVNDKYLKEMNDDAKYILSSYDFNTYLMNNSSKIKDIFSKTSENELSKNILVEKPNNESILKITFVTKNKENGIEFAKEYVKLANEYIKNTQLEYFTKMTNTLEKQYDELNKKTKILEYRDAQADSTISKLIFYKQIKEDKNDVVRLTNFVVKGKYNKKIIVLGSFLLAFALVIFKEELN